MTAELTRIVHGYTGMAGDYAEWDEVFSMDGRCWHACPVCGFGVCSPIAGPMMAHKACIQQIRGHS